MMNKQRKGLLLLLVFVGLLMAATAVTSYHLGKRTTTASPAVQESVTASPTVAPTPTAAPIVLPTEETLQATADWKTYTHKDYGYSVKFPHTHEPDTRFYPYMNFGDASAGPKPGIQIFIYPWQSPGDEEKCATDDECFASLQTVVKGAESAGSNDESKQIEYVISGRPIKGFEIWRPDISHLEYALPVSLNGRFVEVKLVVYNYPTKAEALTQKPQIENILSTLTFE